MVATRRTCPLPAGFLFMRCSLTVGKGTLDHRSVCNYSNVCSSADGRSSRLTHRAMEPMKTIGIRASPNDVTFVIFDAAERTIVNVEKIKIPKALAVPDALKYVRNHILDVLAEYGIERGGIRVTESSAQRQDIRRIELEGVIQEAFASSTLQRYFCGQISSISARVGIPRTDFKPLVNGEQNFDLVENWSDLDKEEREATLAAIGAENA